MEFFALLDDGLNPTPAARAVAAKWPVVESTIFHDANRYIERVTVDAKLEARAARVEIAQMWKRANPEAFAAMEEELSRHLKAQLAARNGTDPLDEQLISFDFRTLPNDGWLVLIGLLSTAVSNAERNGGR